MKPVKPVLLPLRFIKDSQWGVIGMLLLLAGIAVLGLLVFCISQIILICSSWG